MKLKFKFNIDILKRNPLLTSIVAVALIITLVLIYMIYDENNSRVESGTKLEELKERIQILNSTKPYPSEKNIELIQEDITNLKIQTFALEDVFGNIYEKPLLAFVRRFNKEDIEICQANLSELDKESNASAKKKKEEEEAKLKKLQNLSDENLLYDFAISWKSFIENEKTKKSELSIAEIFNNFRRSRNYTVEVFNEARNDFMAEFQKITLEPLNNETIDDYILASLGIPLDFSRIRCKNIISDIEKELNRILLSKNTSLPGGEIVLFPEFTSVPKDDEIPYIIHYSRFMEDFFQRAARSGIQSIESYKKLDGLKGREDSNFLIFKYQLNVVTSMETLRMFLDNLQEAYKDNRIYKIKSLKMSVLDDVANNISPYDSKLPPDQQNKILIGSADILRASIVLEYVIFKKKVL